MLSVYSNLYLIRLQSVHGHVLQLHVWANSEADARSVLPMRMGEKIISVEKLTDVDAVRTVEAEEWLTENFGG